MSQLNNGAAPATQQQSQSQTAGAPAAADELQLANEDAAAARHLTAIRIRGQLAEVEGEAPQD